MQTEYQYAQFAMNISGSCAISWFFSPFPFSHIDESDNYVVQFKNTF